MDANNLNKTPTNTIVKAFFVSLGFAVLFASAPAFIYANLIVLGISPIISFILVVVAIGCFVLPRNKIYYSILIGLNKDNPIFDLAKYERKKAKFPYAEFLILYLIVGTLPSFIN